MTNRSFFAWSIVGALLLAGCQNPDQRETVRVRGKGEKTQKNQCVFATPGTRVRTPIGGETEKSPPKADAAKTAKPTRHVEKLVDSCLDLSLLTKCLKAEDNEVARVLTRDIGITEPGAQSEKPMNVTDTKVLAQLLAAGGDVKLRAETGVRLKDVRKEFDFLNAAVQEKCSSVVTTDSAGRMTPYKIKQSSPTMLLLEGPKQETLMIQARGSQQLIVSRSRELNRTKICGVEKDLTVTERLEISFGAAIDKNPVIGKSLAQVLKNHTDASDTLSEAIEGRTFSASSTPDRGGKRRERPNRERRPRPHFTPVKPGDGLGAGPVELPAEAIFEAYGKLDPKNLKNLECGSGAPGSMAPTKL